MKNFVLQFIENYSSQIIEIWISRLSQKIKNKIPSAELETFIKSFLEILTNCEKIESCEKLTFFLSTSYDLFSSQKLTMPEINRIFSVGKNSIFEIIKMHNSSKYTFLMVHEFLDVIFDQIYSEYLEIHQENKVKILSEGRDRLLKKLEINQQYLQNILQYSDSAIMVVDANEEFIAWNKGAEKIFGYLPEEIIGKNSSTFLPEGDKYLHELKNIVDEVKAKGFVKIVETERMTKDNRMIPVQLNVAMLPGEDNSYAGRTVVITDVSEVRKLQQQVDQSEKLAVIGQLAAGVAHEIGNPLASISSIVQILQRKSKDQFISDQLANVKDNISRISKIVRELVDLSRPPSHDESITQINEVIKTAVGIVKYDKRVKRVEFKTYLDENLPLIKVVPDQLIQVFINILINALDAIEGEGIIKVKSSYDEKYIFVSLLDNGCGMELETITRIFDPFFSTKQVGKGTGLGLSVSFGIVKKIGGDIKVNSKLGNGSEFIVQIPL